MCKLLTVAETADRLRLSKDTVYKLIELGRLKSLRVTTGRIHVTEQAVEDLLHRAGQEVGTVSPTPAIMA